MITISKGNDNGCSSSGLLKVTKVSMDSVAKNFSLNKLKVHLTIRLLLVIHKKAAKKLKLLRTGWEA